MPGLIDEKILRNSGLEATYKSALGCDAVSGGNPDLRKALRDFSAEFCSRARDIINDPGCPAHGTVEIAVWARDAAIAGHLSDEQMQELIDLDRHGTKTLEKLLT